jgi:LacI family transcriptional regulator
VTHAPPAHPAPPSVADVARLAGVSPATVSRAFNAPALLGAPTLERVQRAAQQLGYQPYGLARSLRRRRSMVVGIVMPSLRYAYYAGTLERLQALLAQAGYTVLLISANHDAQAELDGVRALMAQGVDGVVLFGRPLHDESAALLLPAAVCRTCAAGQRWTASLRWPSTTGQPWPMWCTIWWGLATASWRWWCLSRRWATACAVGWRRCARRWPAMGCRCIRRRWWTMGAWMHLPAARRCARCARAAWPPRRWCAATTSSPPACCSRRRSLGLRVPQDLSVTGYNDSSLARAFEPAITSVDTPVELHAQEVARVLVAALRDGEPIPCIRLPTQLRVRASSGPAPAART